MPSMSSRRLTRSLSAAVMCSYGSGLDPFSTFLQQQAVRRALRDKRAFEIGLQHGMCLMLCTTLGLVALLLFGAFGFLKPYQQFQQRSIAHVNDLYAQWGKAAVGGLSLMISSVAECLLFFGPLRSVDCDLNDEFNGYISSVKQLISELQRMSQFAAFLALPYASQQLTPHTPSSSESPLDASWAVCAVKHVAQLSEFRRRVRGVTARRRLLVATGTVCGLAQLAWRAASCFLTTPVTNIIVRLLALCISVLEPLSIAAGLSVLGFRGTLFYFHRICMIDERRVLVLENATLQTLDDLTVPTIPSE